MAYQPIYSGQAQVRLDAKNRFILPAIFRREAEEEDPSGEFTIAPGKTGCLDVFTKNGWRERVRAMYDEMRTYAGDAQAFEEAQDAAELYVHAGTPVKIGEQGRICLPAQLVDAAELTGEVIVAGSIDHMQIWSPAQYQNRFKNAMQDPKKMHDWVSRLAMGNRHKGRQEDPS